MTRPRLLRGNVLVWAVVAFIFASGNALFAAEVSINPSVSTSGLVGNVAVSVLYQSQGATVSALQFDLEYDRSALTITATAGTSTNNASKTLVTSVLPNGDTRFLIFGVNQTVIGDGPIVNLTIQVNANSSVASYSLGFLNAAASDSAGQAVPIAAHYGSINITPPVAWQPLSNQPFPTFGAAFLLTDGRVLVQDNGPNNNGSPNWWKLTPDQTGNYISGSWLQMASMPAGYGPLYYASAVLSDGRLVVIGGEFNSSGTVVQTNQGAIYDSKTDNWTSLVAPNGWAQIGDAPSVVLPDGRFLLAHIFDSQLALLDPVTLTWSVATSTGKSDPSAGEGFSLLPDGTVLTVNATASPGAQRYVSSTGQWISAGSTPVSLANGQIGPAVLRPDGNVFVLGVNGHNAVYTPPSNPENPGTWAAAPDFPNIPGEGQLDVAEGPACLLPSGNVLVAASAGFSTPPVHFFEFDGTNLTEVPRPPTAINDASNYGHLLLLPNGQVLYFDTLSTAQVYTPMGGPNPAWAPTITLGPTQIGPGATYSISGTQFNGLSQAVSYGDNYQAPTNYPLVSITNQATGHVFYAKTHDHSTMAVATGTAIVSTNFDVPNNIELGPSNLVVVANGIPSASLPVTVVTLKSSATALVSSLNPSAGGQSVTFTATVSSTAGGTPTGTVTFYDGTTSLGTGALNGSGIATFTTSSLVIGSHSITAQYGGDSTFGGSTSSPALTQVVNGKPSAVALISSLNPEVAGQSVTFTATVSSTAGGTPTGTVTFYDGTTLLGTGALNGSGIATFTTSLLVIGSHSITAQYGGDSTFSGSTSSLPISQIVNNGKTSATALVSSLNPSAGGQSVTFTATVSSTAGGTPTGTVTFYDGTTSLGTGALNGSGATFTTSSLVIGSHSITAQYGGDSTFGGSTSSPALTQVVNGKPSAVALISSLNPEVAGQSVTFTATVSSTAGGTPTGTVTFYDGTTSLGTGALNGSGIATFTTSLLVIGSHSITAQYGGDSTFGGSTSSPALTQVVNGKPSAVALISSLNPSAGGQSVTFTATVSSTAGGTPTGTVTFYDGTTSLGTGALNGRGIATFTTSSLVIGSHSITAQYGGDSTFSSSTSSLPISQVVSLFAAKISINPSVSTSGLVGNVAVSVLYQSQGATVSALQFDLEYDRSALTITATAGTSTNNASKTLVTSVLPNGDTRFLIFGVNQTVIGDGPIVNLTIQVNANSSVASYSLGFLNAAASDSAGQAVPIAALSGSIAITRKVSATALVSSLNPEVAGQSVTFTATVSSTAGGTPTGTVTFFKGSTALGTGAVTLNGSGVATLSTSVLVVGSPSITASYSGDANYAASVSPAVTETVNAAGFAPPATGLTVTAGQNLPTNLTLYAAAGSGLNFTLSCLGAPAKTTCLFGSNPVAPGPPPNGTTVQMTLQTSSSELPPRPSNRAPRPWGTLGIFTALAAILAGTNHLRHAPRRRLAFGMCVAVFALASILISCGGGGAGSSPTLPYTGTPKGPVTFTVNGTSGTTTISTQVTVTVQ